MAANPLPTPPRTLTIDFVGSADGTATLVCHGRITTATSGLFKSEVKRLVPEHRYVLADLSDVDFVDSAGLGDVVAAYLSCQIRRV